MAPATGTAWPVIFGTVVVLTLIAVFLAYLVQNIRRIRQEKKFISKILANAKALVMVLDRDGKIIEFNTACEKLAGRQFEEVAGKKFDDLPFFPPNGKGSNKGAQNADVAELPSNFETFFSSQNGSDYFIDWSITDLKDDNGDVKAFVCTGIDLTERNKFERVLRKSEERYRTLFESTPSGIITSGPDGRTISANPAAVKILGYKDVKEMIGKFAVDHYANPAQREVVQQELEEKGHLENVEAILLKNGNDEQVHVIGNLKMHKSEHGEIDRIESIFTDVTKHKKAENELKLAYDELETRVQERTIELIEANKILKDEISTRKRVEKEIKSALEEKEILLTEIHHRVKNNLQMISSLLSLQSKNTDNKEAQQLMKESQHRVQSIALLHENLYLSDDLRKIDLADYIKKLSSTLYDAYGVDVKQIVQKINVSDVSINLDKALLCGFIINELVANSLKHAFKDGKPGEIQIDLKKEQGRKMSLVVADNGSGLPSDLNLQNVQSLGLRLVTMLVKQLKGTIEVQNGYGSVFRINFEG